MHDTVNGRPETAAFDAVLGRSLTVADLGVTCVKAHGRPRLLPPVLRVSRAWCLDPLIGRHPFVPQPPAPSSLTLSHPPSGGEPLLAPLLIGLLPGVSINIGHYGPRPTVLHRTPATPSAPSLGL
ncbi:hypothetical protein PDE_06250 [Penicillium oxalicum 114-2]|uniref:Uncharacterized protein n=1 Tax=Penicillium oxalicum (strain 114-2 / CGMCC 5302) TaxID=933388 RepID=S7ZKZ5_PENO1|nr:hypothetical protein PDE_06250 [Penicillium oxalicum 114-2]